MRGSNELRKECGIAMTSTSELATTASRSLDAVILDSGCAEPTEAARQDMLFELFRTEKTYFRQIHVLKHVFG